jgi:GDP-mannose 6-dehydrogenase
MKVAVFGLGYVGCVSAACFSSAGHEVYGVDINHEKVKLINHGKSPIVEPGLDKLISEGVSNQLIRATTVAADAVEHADVVFICVGTPSNSNGSLDLSYVKRVCQDIGQALANKKGYAVISIRSTMLPGNAEETLLPLLEEASGKRAGKDFGFCVNPEFLREGSAVKDFYHPPFTLIGSYDHRGAEQLAGLYMDIEAPLYEVKLGEAEMVKYASNAFHALKVAFANEVGNICQTYGIDSHPVMEVFSRDTKLNLSPYYLKPGFSFGGSCLPKDLRAVLYAANQQDVDVPVLDSILPSNQLQTQKVVDRVLEEEKRRVGIVGLSFKPNTDDLRESPALELTEQLIGKGLNIKVYDHEVVLSKVHGSNRRYLENTLPHIDSILRDNLQDVIESSEIVVVTKHLSEKEMNDLFNYLDEDQLLIDLVRLEEEELEHFQGEYYGIAW